MRELNEKSLVQLLRRRPRRGEKRGWRCPDERQIAAYADRQLQGGEKDRVEAHLADCAFCLDQVAFLVRERKAEMSVSVPASVLSRVEELASGKARREVSPGWGWGAVATAAACLAVVLAVSLRPPQRERGTVGPPRSVRPSAEQPSGAAPPISETVPAPRSVRNAKKGISGPQLVFPATESSVLSSKVEFRWTPVKGALYYEVRLLTAEGDLVWEQRTEGTSARPPAGMNLTAGEKYFVWIRAYLAEGHSVQSPAAGFTVAGHHY